MTKVGIILLIFGPLAVMGQMKSPSLELNAQWHTFKMSNLNEFIADTSYYNNKPQLYDDVATEGIKSGYQFGQSINFKLSNILEFGIWGSYQYGKMVRHIYSKDMSYPSPSNAKIYAGTYSIKTEAFSVGLKSCLYINNLLHLEQKETFLKHVELGIEIGAGASFSHLEELLSNGTAPGNTVSEMDKRSTDWVGVSSLKLGYKFLRNPVLSSAGIKAGYQFLRTGTVKDEAGYVIAGGGNRTIKLDFSGFFVGLYLNIGK